MKNPRPMRDAASRLTDKEYRFIRKEFGITKKELLHLSEDLLIELYDELSSIEANPIQQIMEVRTMRVMKWEKENRLLRRQDTAETTYSTAVIDGECIFQIQTFGPSSRKIKGVASQTMQFDRQRAIELIEILKQEFSL